MLFSQAVVARIGYLDERFFAYHEDVDYSLRATQAGFSVWYQPMSIIMHRVSHSTEGNLQFRTFLEAQSRILFFIKHIRGINLLVVIPLEMVHFVRFLGAVLLHNQIGLAWSYIRGVFAGLRMIKRAF
jgi:GT2 family glycosyltransferase